MAMDQIERQIYQARTFLREAGEFYRPPLGDLPKALTELRAAQSLVDNTIHRILTRLENEGG